MHIRSSQRRRPGLLAAALLSLLTAGACGSDSGHRRQRRQRGNRRRRRQRRSRGRRGQWRQRRSFGQRRLRRRDRRGRQLRHGGGVGGGSGGSGGAGGSGGSGGAGGAGGGRQRAVLPAAAAPGEQAVPAAPAGAPRTRAWRPTADVPAGGHHRRVASPGCGRAWAAIRSAPRPAPTGRSATAWRWRPRIASAPRAPSRGAPTGSPSRPRTCSVCVTQSGLVNAYKTTHHNCMDTFEVTVRGTAVRDRGPGLRRQPGRPGFGERGRHGLSDKVQALPTACTGSHHPCAAAVPADARSPRSLNTMHSDATTVD